MNAVRFQRRPTLGVVLIAVGVMMDTLSIAAVYSGVSSWATAIIFFVNGLLLAYGGWSHLHSRTIVDEGGIAQTGGQRISWTELLEWTVIPPTAYFRIRDYPHWMAVTKS